MQDQKDLKNAGLKATLPRLKVLSLFENSKERHLSAEDIYKVMLNSGEDVGLATVYRVIRHHFESGKAVFELNHGNHHDHIVCVKCGRVEEFYDAEIEKRQEAAAAKFGFKMQDHSLTIYGICEKQPCGK
jgi:Fur family ferric uptake transcriptional regulator